MPARECKKENLNPIRIHRFHFFATPPHPPIITSLSLTILPLLIISDAVTTPQSECYSFTRHHQLSGYPHH